MWEEIVIQSILEAYVFCEVPSNIPSLLEVSAPSAAPPLCESLIYTNIVLAAPHVLMAI